MEAHLLGSIIPSLVILLFASSSQPGKLGNNCQAPTHLPSEHNRITGLRQDSLYGLLDHKGAQAVTVPRFGLTATVS